jgi:hypothetical protein
MSPFYQRHASDIYRIIVVVSATTQDLGLDLCNQIHLSAAALCQLIPKVRPRSDAE